MLEPDLTEHCWIERVAHWRQISGRTLADVGSPIILDGHGVSLRVEGGTLAIKNGFTHYPQKLKTYRFFKGDLDLPERIVLLDCSGSISFDVLSWLAEQNISLTKIDWRGEVICVVPSLRTSSKSSPIAWQFETRNDPQRRLEFSISNITKKIENSILTLEKSVNRNSAWNTAVEFAYAALTKLDKRQPKNIADVLLIEAVAAAAYFKAWRGIPLKWKKVGRKLIPASWNAFTRRASPSTVGPMNRNASHPANAILNYAYSILQSQIQIAAVADGYDPTAGIMHEWHHASTPFVYDLMEPERPKIDRLVLDFFRNQTFHPADFVIMPDGICRLHPELAKCVANSVYTNDERQHSCQYMQRIRQ